MFQTGISEHEHPVKPPPPPPAPKDKVTPLEGAPYRHARGTTPRFGSSVGIPQISEYSMPTCSVYVLMLFDFEAFLIFFSEYDPASMTAEEHASAVGMTALQQVHEQR